MSQNYHCWGNYPSLTLCGLPVKSIAVTSVGMFVMMEELEKVVDDPKWYSKCPTCATHPALAMKLLEELP